MNNSEQREQAEAAAAAWIGSRESEGWSQTDQAMFAEWLEQSLDHRVAWLRLSAAWEQTHRLEAVKGLAWGKSHRNPTHARWSIHRRWTRALPAAAASLLCLGAVSWFWFTRDRAYHTEIGAMTAVSLTDGSRITLNTDTLIQAHLSGSVIWLALSFTSR